MTASPHWIYGADSPDPEPLALRMGAVSLLFEPHSGFVRTVKLNQGAEILRGIYIAVRDRNWNTVPTTISNLEVQQKRGGFHISFSAECRQDDIHFTYSAELTGTAEGKITYSMRGEAQTSFFKNRIGFCVLHPIDERAGKNVTVTHSDGMTTRGKFPEWISPHQPFHDIRSLTHDVMWGVRATVRFEGDVFEMEDQRNWTDASFKTYSTPLAEPYPVEIAGGSVIAQSVTLELTGRIPERTTETPLPPITLSQPMDILYPLPNFGFGFASQQQKLTKLEAERITALRPSHLRVIVDFAQESWRDAFRQTVAVLEEARLDTIPLEVALFLRDGDDPELDALIALVRQLPRRTVKRWLISQHGEVVTPEATFERVRIALDKYQHRADFHAGTNAYFTELNRNRPTFGRHFFFSLNPQVHTFDTRSLMETLPIQEDTVRNARRFGTNPFIAVSPITLKPRHNPNATTTEESNTSDPRQYALCGAAWTLGSLESLMEVGVHSATYYETFSAAGVMETEAKGGRVAPLYHVLADFGEFAKGRYVRLNTSGNRDQIAALSLQWRDRKRLLVANLTPTAVDIELLFPAQRLMLKTLDETNVEYAMTQPEAYRAEQGEKIRGTTITNSYGREARRVRLTLSPYALARLEGESLE